MNPWLDRLRKQKCPATYATEATAEGGSAPVASVAYPPGGLQKSEAAAAPAITVDVLTRWLPAASERELDRMSRRERLAQSLGLDLHEAGRVADVLHMRDRSRDDRRLCAECQHLLQHGEDWGCVSNQGVSKTPSQQVVFLQPQRCAGFRQNPNWPANP